MTCALVAVGLVVVTPTTHARAETQTFSYTGAVQSFTVPAGVTKLQVTADGGNGRATRWFQGEEDSVGGRVTATLSVTPGDELDIYVGGAGGDGTGGFNGGGGVPGGDGTAGGGGGATDVRTAGGGSADRLVVAGGGGGAREPTTQGGDGGGDGTPDGQAGTGGTNASCDYGGGGGTTNLQPGAGGALGDGCGVESWAAGSPGDAEGQGGEGGALLVEGVLTSYAGGGGGGYYGGGGGAGSNSGAGSAGGGGSSYVTSGSTGVSYAVKAPEDPSHGQLTIAYTVNPDQTVTFDANGGTGSMNNQATNTPTALTANTYTRTAHTFTDWNTATDGTGTSYADQATYPFTTSTTLYAQWTENPNPDPTPPTTNPGPTPAPPGADPGQAPTFETDLHMQKSTKKGKRLHVGKKQRLIKAVVRNADGEPSISKATARCSARGKTLERKNCALKVKTTDTAVTVRVRPECSTGVKVKVKVVAQVPGAEAASWRRAWKVQRSPRIACD